MEIGEKIKMFRGEKNFSQQKLSDLSGLARITITQYELGKFNPREDSLKKIAEALNIPVQCFLSVDELLKQQKKYILSLPVKERLTVLRLCAGYSTTTLAQKVVSTIHSSDTIPPDEETYDKNVESMDLELRSVENGYRELSNGYIGFLASALNIPVELLSGDCNISDGSEKRSPVNLKKCDDKKTELLEKMDQVIQLLNDIHFIEELSPEFQQYYSKLNSEGKQKLLDYAKDLSQLEKYTAPDPDSDNEE